MVRLRASEIAQSFLVVVLKQKIFAEYLISGAQGSANQASITLDHTFSFPLCYNHKVVENFGVLAKSFFERFLSVNGENEHLEKMLNVLLTKLSFK